MADASVGKQLNRACKSGKNNLLQAKFKKRQRLPGHTSVCVFVCVRACVCVLGGGGFLRPSWKRHQQTLLQQLWLLVQEDVELRGKSRCLLGGDGSTLRSVMETITHYIFTTTTSTPEQI